MRKYVVLAATALAALSPVCGSGAARLSPVTPDRVLELRSYDLNAAAGQNDHQCAAGLGAATAFAARVEIVRMYQHETWLPGFTFELNSGQERLVIQFIGLRGREAVSLRTVRSRGSSPLASTTASGVVEDPDTLDLVVDWQHPDEAVVGFRGREYGARLGFRPDTLCVVSASGHMKADVRLLRPTVVGSGR